MIPIKTIWLLLCLMAYAPALLSQQQADSLQAKAQQVAQLPDKLVGKLDTKYEKLDAKLEASSTKLLKRMQRQEAKLQRKLATLDSNKAKQLFTNSQHYYEGLNKKIKDKTAKLNGLNAYMPRLDSLGTASSFLQQAGNINGLTNGKLAKLKELSDRLKDVQSSIQSATDIRKSLSERKQQLQEALKQYDLGKQFKSMNKEIYYYQEQLKEYKSILQDQQKLEEKALSFIRELPAFKEFMGKNSQLASIFGMSSPNGAAGMPGLSGSSIPIVNGIPSRGAVQQFIQSSNGLTNAGNGIKKMQAQSSNLKSAIDQLKAKASAGQVGDSEIPEFKPNTQKTKPFWKRLEYGFDFQFGKAVNYVPATSDIALKIGYKINDKSSAGIGIGYKMGLGNGWKDIHVTHEGLGLRTYLKWKLVKGLDVQGGSEWNYMAQFKNIEQLKAVDAWQQAALLGLSKNYNVGKKLKGNMQVLYNFLYKQQVPLTQPVLFRVGYSF